MVIRYDIITGETSKTLTEKVNLAIEEGWQPQGGLMQTQVIGGGFQFMQAMVLSQTAMQVAKHRMSYKHECVYLADGGPCQICGKTAIES